ncbi:hypothetical protein BVG19_g3653 [[Candida] boidinii]|nr:hypothetical protein BVG19_g3653 [[Candida] boidinii]OWB52417.1 hypothetical protein B5S27_g3992 [[Candida] boidinii]OWB85106.1 hypothetical protein B5S33_g3764 [[Candida] boidinii]
MSWEEVTDEEGRIYYYNSETQQTQWDKPNELLSIIEKALVGTNWAQYTTDDGQIYYYDSVSGESIWSLPSEILENLKKNGDFEEYENSITEKDVGGGADDSVDVVEDENNGTVKDTEIPIEDQSSNTDDTGTNENFFSGNDLIDIEKIIESNENVKESETDNLIKLNYPFFKSNLNKVSEDDKEEFLKLLKIKKIDSNWSFNKLIKLLIDDNELIYWKIDDLLIKKNLFELYLINKSDEELQKIENAKEQYKIKFFKVLDNYNIKYYTRWSTCSKLIIDEPIYSLVPNKLKIEMFNEYTHKLKLNHDSETKKLKKLAINELDEYLTNQIKLKINSNWSFILNLIQNDKRFKENKHFNILNKLDILTVYESIMNKLYDEFNKFTKFEKLKNYRSDRKARDNFKNYLNDLSIDNTLKFNSNTSWFEFISIVKENENFLNFIGRRGSSPIDIWWDYLDKENQILKAKKDIVNQLLINNNNEFKFEKFEDLNDLNELNNFENFKNFEKIIKTDKNCESYSSNDIKLIYKLLHDEIYNPPQKVSSTTSTTSNKIGEKRKIDQISNDSSNPKKRLATLGYGSFTKN